MRGEAVVTRRTSLFLGASLAILGGATMASAQGMPPPPPPPTPAESVAQPIPPPPTPVPAGPSYAAPGQTAPQVAPGYPPHGYPQAMFFGPSRLPYNESEPVPPGYEIQTRTRMGMVKAGIATFVPLYALSALYGATYLGNESGGAKQYGPMIIPIIGPLVTMGTSDNGDGNFILLLDGAGQITGAVLFIVGMLSEEKYLARNTTELNLRPEVFISPKSIAMRWEF
jgi:hypothetical protein